MEGARHTGQGAAGSGNFGCPLGAGQTPGAVGRARGTPGAGSNRLDRQPIGWCGLDGNRGQVDNPGNRLDGPGVEYPDVRAWRGSGL